jgi:hypothetical protein
MKAILEFNLPEDKDDFEVAQQGWQWKLIVSDLLDFLRSETKYKDHTAEEYAVFDLIRDRLSDEIRDRNLSVW